MVEAKAHNATFPAANAPPSNPFSDVDGTSIHLGHYGSHFRWPSRNSFNTTLGPQATPAFSLLPSHHYLPPEALKHRARGPRHPSQFPVFPYLCFPLPSCFQTSLSSLSCVFLLLFSSLSIVHFHFHSSLLLVNKSCRSVQT